ncbi:MAG: hypothetical protein ACMG6S_12365 [Byssovorax sp.]
MTAMELKDPPRLLDPDAGARDFVRQALDAGRADRPGADQLARLAQRLPLGMAPPPIDPGASPIGAPAAAIPSALPGAILGAVLGLAVIGLHTLATRSEAPPAAPHEAPAAIHLAAPAGAAAPERARLDDAITTPKAAAARAIAAPASAASSSAEPAPRAADPTPSSASTAITAVEGASPDLAAGSPQGTFAVEPPTVDSETDIQLLHRALDALGSAPSRALDLVSRHAARFPGSALGQEREVLAIDALDRLGRSSEARARAAAFAARFPSSAHLHRLEALVPSTGIDSEVHKAPAEAAPTP